MLKYFNKYVLCSFMFIFFIFFIGTRTIEQEFQNIVVSVYNGDNFYEDFTNQVKLSYTDNLASFDRFLDIFSSFQKILNVNIIEDNEMGYVAKDSNDYLHFAEYSFDVTEYSDSLINFKEYLDSLDIPFLYVQAPGKCIENFTELPKGITSGANENTDVFLNNISNAGVDVLDLRELMILDNLDKLKMFYKTDHHWTTKTAFWAFQKVVDKFSELGLKLGNLDCFTNLSNYNVELKENCFCGSQGKRIGKYYVGVDDYEYIYPKFDTNYFRICFDVDGNEYCSEGNFENTLVSKDILNQNYIYSNKHATYFSIDNPFEQIYNNSVDNGVKVLVIKDSFALPFCAFLSTCVSELDMIDLRAFEDGKLREYIEYYRPDVVMVLYNTVVYSEELFNLD